MQRMYEYFKEHDGFLWLAALIIFAGFKSYPTIQEKFLSPCKGIYQDVRAAETELQIALESRNAAVSEFFELENAGFTFGVDNGLGAAMTKMLEADDPVFEKRDLVYRLVSMEPKCFARKDVITSNKEIKNYENYLEREAVNTSRPIYLPGIYQQSDFPQWGFKSVIPEGK
jgi:hypothetical protein